MKNNYILLYYFSFILTLLGQIITFPIGDNLDDSNFIAIILIIITVTCALTFKILLSKYKKLEKATIYFPISYVIFAIIIYSISHCYDKILIIPTIQYTYFSELLIIPFVLLSLYSILSINYQENSNEKHRKK